MQQHLMQMQPMMSTYNPNAITTDIIQQYLDENKRLILTILENQSTGKISECAENQAKLQQNLMYLAAIADSQPQAPTMHTQYPPSSLMQPATRYLQHQQAQPLTQQSLMAARASMLYSQQQQPQSALQRQQQEELHNQLAMRSGQNNGLHMLHRGSSMGGGSGSLSTGGFPEFSRNAGDSFQSGSRGVTVASKADMGNAGSTEGKGGQSGDGTEPLYLKGSEDEGN